ncbi:MAG: DUF3999 family protein [Thermodesulfobacteriota bacterium]
MKTRILLVLSAVLGFTSFAAAGVPAEWKTVQSMEIGRAGWVKISLPVETLSAAKPDLADLRLLDGSGRETAYRIERPLQSPPEDKPAGNLRIRLEGTGTTATFTTGLKTALGAVSIETPAGDFIKAVSVEGSNDEGRSWTMLVRNTFLFRRGNAQGLTATVPAGAWAMARISLDDSRDAPIPVTGIRVHAAETEAAPAEPMPVTVISREEEMDRTRLTLELPGANLTLASLGIETPEALFTRRVTLQYLGHDDNGVREVELAGDTLYRIAVNDQAPLSRLAFAADVTAPDRQVILTIHNGDSPPLPVTAVRGFRRPVYLVFSAAGPAVYQLISGNPAGSAPHYDLKELNADMVPAELISAAFSPPAVNPDWTPPEVLPEVGESGSAIELSTWKYHKRIDIRTAGVQRLELDPEVLDLAQPSLTDLRIVKNGRQVPYLIEPSVSLGELMPEVQAADDPPLSTVSRLRLALPVRRLPLAALKVEVGTAFFQRRVTLYEEAPDRRGNQQTLLRASAVWSRTIGEKSPPMVLPLAFRTITGNLILDIDNGDNPALDIGAVRISYRANRLLFKASPGEDARLYFGNPTAPPPRYDIDLIAGHFLSAAKNKASLAPLERQGPPSWQEKYRFGEKAVWLFWIVLAGLVAGLLVIISRLLPKAK